MMRPLLAALLVAISVNVAAVDIQNYINAVGVVSGNASNDKIVVEVPLTQPLLFKTTKQEHDRQLTGLYIENSQLINVLSSQLHITHISPLKQGDLESRYTLELWTDGTKQSNIVVYEKGKGVYIKLLEPFDTLELKASGPVKMQFPKHYRGPFASTIKVRANYRAH